MNAFFRDCWNETIDHDLKFIQDSSQNSYSIVTFQPLICVQLEWWLILTFKTQLYFGPTVTHNVNLPPFQVKVDSLGNPTFYSCGKILGFYMSFIGKSSNLNSVKCHFPDSFDGRYILNFGEEYLLGVGSFGYIITTDYVNLVKRKNRKRVIKIQKLERENAAIYHNELDIYDQIIQYTFN